jgi:hypothetical protein
MQRAQAAAARDMSLAQVRGWREEEERAVEGEKEEELGGE